MKQVREQLRLMLSECFDGEIPVEQIRKETALINELNMHSIVYVEFIVSVEDCFSIEIPDESLDVNLYKTYGELEDMIVGIISGEK